MAGATLTWATLALLGLGRLARLAWLTVAAKLVGAASLVWIGCRMIAGSRRPAPAAGSMPNARHGGWMALRRGYPCSMTNPKAAALVFSAAPVQAGYRRAKGKIDVVVGGVLVALGARLAVAR